MTSKQILTLDGITSAFCNTVRKLGVFFFLMNMSFNLHIKQVCGPDFHQHYIIPVEHSDCRLSCGF